MNLAKIADRLRELKLTDPEIEEIIEMVRQFGHASMLRYAPYN